MEIDDVSQGASPTGDGAYYFKNYRLEEQLGEGGMGVVYRAVDVTLNRTVALKVLREELSADAKFIETFLREVEITAQLNHPNVVQVYSFGEHEGRYYLVMEYLGFYTLDDEILERRQLTEIEVIDLGIGVASGLSFALEKGGLIHRDIKPGNILFGPSRTPKVVDFGLAVTPETADQMGNEIWGTPYYVSPERLERIPEDFRSDMYSLGVSLYHALAGRPPFDADTAELVAAKHLTSTPLPLKTFAPNITDQTAYAIMRSMARYPQQRFNSYREFIEQLEDAKRRLLQDPVPPQITTQSLRVLDAPSSSSKGTIILVVTGVVLLVLAIFVAIFFLTW